MVEWLLFPFNSEIAREHDFLANISFMPDFKLYTNWPFYLVESGHLLDCMTVIDLEPPDPTVSVHIGRVICITFSHLI